MRPSKGETAPPRSTPIGREAIFHIKNARRELWIFRIAGSFKNMKIRMEAKTAIVTSVGREPPAPGIFYTAKGQILSEIISSISLRNGPEIQKRGDDVPQ